MEQVEGYPCRDWPSRRLGEPSIWAACLFLLFGYTKRGKDNKSKKCLLSSLCFVLKLEINNNKTFQRKLTLMLNSDCEMAK